MTTRVEEFERYRSLLFAIAYRMLGSVAEAEDIVQEAYLRWRDVIEEEVRSPRSYLSAVVTRLSINRLRSMRVRREQYVGPWLPEPLLPDRTEEFPDSARLDDSLSMAFLRVPAFVARVLGGDTLVTWMLGLRGASNEKIKRETGWRPRYESWREGFSEDLATAVPGSVQR